ncbi:ubiquitin-protein ligase E3 [Schizosaccharomyces cryophilus OY26]|uniref:HECT-type E3 ubiquitin transferase n=1 Tax=Schizosaccharomyces cryophilus (strain OY26 / ATCC MYA-4695 / CBS 11777 / NBRC 106824 / NRRL Y48691) TaxID=653667 RepID=S9VXR0_SCHCR|nr:ubiquitin-protein ligase E3 [Schizosaccharomyces cryophilus OY26]EPY50999.1 ubiquitin-protein ligase E3 [Schizosaccharomyces cryophilus OY26]
MPLSFEGAFKAKRNVNLGGKRTTNDRGELVRKAAIERKNREERRKTEFVSIQLQSLSRGVLCRERIKNEFRSQWYENYLPVGAHQLNVSDWDKLSECIQKFVIFADPQLEFGALQNVISALLDFLHSEFSPKDLTSSKSKSGGSDEKIKEAELSNFYSIKSELSSLSFPWVWKRFTTLCLKSFSKALPIIKEERQYADLYPFLEALGYFSVFLEVYEIPIYYDCLMTFYEYSHLQQEFSMFRSAFSFSLLSPLDDTKDTFNEVQQLFIFHVFTRDSYESLLDIISSNLVVSKIFPSLSFAKEADIMSSLTSLETSKLFCLAGACLHLLHVEVQSSTLWCFCSLALDALYTHSENSVINRFNAPVDLEEDEDDEFSFVQDYYAHVQVVAKQFNKLLTSQNLSTQRAFAEALSSNFITKVFTEITSSTILNVSHFFSSMLKLFPSNRTSTLMYVSLIDHVRVEPNSSFVQYSWDIFTESPIYHLFSRKVDVNSIMQTNSGYWYQLQLLLDVYSRMLFTMVDEEFHSVQHNPLYNTRDKLCILLKNLVLGLYWDVYASKEVNDNSLVDITQLRVSSTSLLQRLFRINYRKPYLHEDFFLMEEYFNLNEFETGALQEAQSASTMDIDLSTGMKVDNYNESRPKLNILNNCSFFLPFRFRIHLLQQLITMDKQANGFIQPFGHLKHAVIRRNRIFDDGFDAFYNLGKMFKGSIRITFVDEHGVVEEGIDGGGLTKEFLTSICKTVFDINYGLFSETKAHLLYPNTHAYAQDIERLRCYEFLGMLIGKCIYEGIQIDAAFAPFFVSKWLGHPSYFDDLTSLDNNLYEGLIFLKHYDGDVENDLALNFTVVHEEFGVRNVIELIPNGGNVAVTNDNRLQYIHLISNYYLNARLSKQCRAFTNGFTQIIDPHWLAMFHENEIQVLVGGDPVPIDVSDLKKHTVYAGGYELNSPTIQLFWEVLRELDEEDKRNFVKFVTSVARPPILGFKALMPSFCIRTNGEDESRLPTASTCVNLLKLPVYTSKKTLKEKLIVAVRSGGGFGFS